VIADHEIILHQTASKWNEKVKPPVLSGGF